MEREIILRSWPKQEKIRPSWWSPEKVLELLRGGEPTPLLCQRASDECGNAVTARRLRAEISSWCQSLTWGEDMSAAVKLWRRSTDGSGEFVLSSDWHDEFLDALSLAEGNIPQAAEYACVGLDLVYARLDEQGPHYDKEFAERVKVIEGLRMARLRENLLTQAEAPTADGAKLAAGVLATAMPALHGNKKQVKVQADVEVSHTHVHTLAPEVVAASAARTKALMAQRRQLGDGVRNTIDLPKSLVRVLEEV